MIDSGGQEGGGERTGVMIGAGGEWRELGKQKC